MLYLEQIEQDCEAIKTLGAYATMTGIMLINNDDLYLKAPGAFNTC